MSALVLLLLQSYSRTYIKFARGYVDLDHPFMHFSRVVVLRCLSERLVQDIGFPDLVFEMQQRSPHIQPLLLLPLAHCPERASGNLPCLFDLTQLTLENHVPYPQLSRVGLSEKQALKVGDGLGAMCVEVARSVFLYGRFLRFLLLLGGVRVGRMEGIGRIVAECNEIASPIEA
jgi:hypothetical protein